jgi:ABC-type Zn2+ transport system substrate-binding protein/surface adhesin
VAQPSTDIATTVGNPSFWGAEGADNFSTSNSLFKEDTDKLPPVKDVHTIPQDIVADVDTQDDIVPTQDDDVVDLEEDHQHAHDLALHNKMNLHAWLVPARTCFFLNTLWRCAIAQNSFKVLRIEYKIITSS